MDYKKIIEVNGLCKSFNKIDVLKNINFDLNESEILSILGPSGSGKTTMLKCLIGLEKFNSPAHSIKIRGQNSIDYLRFNRIAFVPQRYSNYPWLNVSDNIKLGILAREKKKEAIHKFHGAIKHETILNTTIDRDIKNIIDIVGLTGFEHYCINQLSGGMQQRVAIGRALAQNTDIIAFDEPFGALDFRIREKLQLLIKDLNKTILFVTHDIEEALFVADKLIVISGNPTSVTNEYNISFRKIADVTIKYEIDFIKYKKDIQQQFI
jgi:ABC-type nitrate/sulfonate/bicarbonate transport system ATPase subunit